MHRRTLIGAASLATLGATLASGRPAASGDGLVAFTVEIRVRPGFEAELLDLLTPVLDAMRHEPTFVNAVLHCDPEGPDAVPDLRDLDRSRGRRRSADPPAYRAAYSRRLPEILAEERTIGIWRPVRTDLAPKA